MTVRGRVAEVQRVEHIELLRNVPASKFGLQLVDEGQNVVKEADAVEELALDVGRLHRSPALPEILELSMRTVVFHENFWTSVLYVAFGSVLFDLRFLIVIDNVKVGRVYT